MANAKGLFAGYEDGTFRPDRGLTNGQAEKVLRRMLDRYTEDGYTTLTRAEAATLLVRGVCGLDGDCGTPPPPPAPTSATGSRVPQGSGAWKKFTYANEWDDTQGVGYDLADNNPFFVSWLRIGCYGNQPNIAVATIYEVGSQDGPMPVKYRANSAPLRSGTWDVVITDRGIYNFISLPLNRHQSWLQYLIDNPGPLLFEWPRHGVSNARPRTLRWNDTSGLATVAAELNNICGL